MRTSILVLAVVLVSGCSALRLGLAGLIDPNEQPTKQRLFIDTVPRVVNGLCQTTANDGSVVLRFGRYALRALLGTSPVPLDVICKLIRPGEMVMTKSLASPAGPGMVEALEITFPDDERADLKTRKEAANGQ